MSGMAIEIRVLTAADAEVLEKVAPEVFDEAVRPVLARPFLDDPRHHLIVAVDAERVVGFISAVDYVHPDKDRELWINEVGVAPTHQRLGIGRRLLSAMLDHARAIGCGEAWVLTDEDNVPARNLYSSLGGGEGATQVMYTFDL